MYCGLYRKVNIELVILREWRRYFVPYMTVGPSNPANMYKVPYSELIFLIRRMRTSMCSHLLCIWKLMVSVWGYYYPWMLVLAHFRKQFSGKWETASIGGFMCIRIHTHLNTWQIITIIVASTKTVCVIIWAPRQSECRPNIAMFSRSVAIRWWGLYVFEPFLRKPFVSTILVKTLVFSQLDLKTSNFYLFLQ